MNLAWNLFIYCVLGCFIRSIISKSDVVIDSDDDEARRSTKSKFNFASSGAGAIILDKSPASGKGFHHLLDDDRDKYNICPCNEKIRIVIGLSEDVLVTSVVIANYEKYSSTPREFQLLASASYPTDEWINLGTFEASPRLGEQTFEIPHTQSSPHTRYLKFKFLTHYGNEHLCTLSQIKVHGTTVIASFQQEVKRSESIMQTMLSQLQSEDDENLMAQLLAEDPTPSNSNSLSTSTERHSSNIMPSLSADSPGTAADVLTSIRRSSQDNKESTETTPLANMTEILPDRSHVLGIIKDDNNSAVSSHNASADYTTVPAVFSETRIYPMNVSEGFEGNLNDAPSVSDNANSPFGDAQAVPDSSATRVLSLSSALTAVQEIVKPLLTPLAGSKLSDQFHDGTSEGHANSTEKENDMEDHGKDSVNNGLLETILAIDADTYNLKPTDKTQNSCNGQQGLVFESGVPRCTEILGTTEGHGDRNEVAQVAESHASVGYEKSDNKSQVQQVNTQVKVSSKTVGLFKTSALLDGGKIFPSLRKLWFLSRETGMNSTQKAGAASRDAQGTQISKNSKGPSLNNKIKGVRKTKKSRLKNNFKMKVNWSVTNETELTTQSKSPSEHSNEKEQSKSMTDEQSIREHEISTSVETDKVDATGDSIISGSHQNGALNANTWSTISTSPDHLCESELEVGISDAPWLSSISDPAHSVHASEVMKATAADIDNEKDHTESTKENPLLSTNANESFTTQSTFTLSETQVSTSQDANVVNEHETSHDLVGRPVDADTGSSMALKISESSSEGGSDMALPTNSEALPSLAEPANGSVAHDSKSGILSSLVDEISELKTSNPSESSKDTANVICDEASSPFFNEAEVPTSNKGVAVAEHMVINCTTGVHEIPAIKTASTVNATVANETVSTTNASSSSTAATASAATSSTPPLASNTFNTTASSASSSIRLPACLELLKFQEFKAKMEAKFAMVRKEPQNERMSHSSSSATSSFGTQENVFSQLMQKIKSLEMSHAIYELYSIQMSECHYSILRELWHARNVTLSVEKLRHVETILQRLQHQQAFMLQMSMALQLSSSSMVPMTPGSSLSEISPGYSEPLPILDESHDFQTHTYRRHVSEDQVVHAPYPGRGLYHLTDCEMFSSNPLALSDCRENVQSNLMLNHDDVRCEDMDVKDVRHVRLNDGGCSTSLLPTLIPTNSSANHSIDGVESVVNDSAYMLSPFRSTQKASKPCDRPEEVDTFQCGLASNNDAEISKNRQPWENPRIRRSRPFAEYLIHQQRTESSSRRTSSYLNPHSNSTETHLGNGTFSHQVLARLLTLTRKTILTYHVDMEAVLLLAALALIMACFSFVLLFVVLVIVLSVR